MSTLWMCGNTDSLFFSISAEGMAPSGMQLRTEKDTVACETEPLFIIGTKSKKESSLSLVPLLDLYPEDR